MTGGAKTLADFNMIMNTFVREITLCGDYNAASCICSYFRLLPALLTSAGALTFFHVSDLKV